MKDKGTFCENACSIGIIGGTDGPSAIACSTNEALMHQEEFLTYAAEQITAHLRPFSDLLVYLKERYHAQPYPLSARFEEMLKADVMLNHYRHLLSFPPPLPPNPSRRALRRYFQEDTSFEQARAYPAEKLRLEMEAYRISARRIQEVLSCGCRQDAVVKLERKTEYLCIEGGCDELRQDLILRRGVSQEDIRDRSPRFLGYVYTKLECGLLEITGKGQNKEKKAGK